MTTQQQPWGQDLVAAPRLGTEIRDSEAQPRGGCILAKDFPASPENRRNAFEGGP